MKSRYDEIVYLLKKWVNLTPHERKDYGQDNHVFWKSKHSLSAPTDSGEPVLCYHGSLKRVV